MPVAANLKCWTGIPVTTVCADLKRKFDPLFCRRALYNWEEIATVSSQRKTNILLLLL